MIKIFLKHDLLIIWIAFHFSCFFDFSKSSQLWTQTSFVDSIINIPFILKTKESNDFLIDYI